MNVKVSDLMVKNVMTATPHQTVGHVRKVMAKHNVNSMPVVRPGDIPAGIVTTSDLIACESEERPISQIMSRDVYTVPVYADISLAAQTMRKHKIHHVLVTHEKQIVGILSSFDLLQVLDEHRFSVKNAPKQKNVRRLSGGRPETTI